MLDSFFGSLVDGRTLHASYIREPHRTDEDPLSLDLAVRTYKLVEQVSTLARRVADALHRNHAPRPLGCG
jgi:hypothetical protein